MRRGTSLYRGRLGLRLPRENNTLQDELDKLEVFTQQSLMSCDQQKTKILLFSRMKKYDFTPELQLGGQDIEVVEEMKKVGFQLRSDLKTISNTRYIIKKGYSRMWILRRLKALGAKRRCPTEASVERPDTWGAGLGLSAH